MKRLIYSLLMFTGFVAIVCFIIVGVGLGFAGYWLQAGDDLVSSKSADAIVVLSGSYFRPIYAADLYTEGFAPIIYVSKIRRKKSADLLKSVGVDLPPNEEIYRRLLQKRGVPDGAIRFFGDSVISTAQEAEALRELLGNKPKTIILVTSPYHVRRAKYIFEDILPMCKFIATGSPYQSIPKKWWTTQSSAGKVVNETAKIVFYLLGGKFSSKGAIQSSKSEPRI